MTVAEMVSPEVADKLVQEDKGMHIDIRSVSEALNEEIPGSVFLPFDLVSAKRLKTLGIENKAPILICGSGIRAKQAGESLSREMENVTVLDGGIENWKKAGLPVSKGHGAMPIERQVLVGAGSMILLFTILGLTVSPYIFALTIMMTCGMIFAGVTGACGMARILVMMPWNKAPLCGDDCNIPLETKVSS